jgi:outer membrane lipoprotein-sorting protein
MQFVKKIIFISAVFLFSFNATASTAVKSKQDFLTEYKSELGEIENYLQNIKYLTATFTQESPNGNITHGKFYLSRPGKMRVEYDKPSKILVIANGSILTYQDLELDETSYLTTSKTPAAFLTRSNISFSAKDVEITNFVRGKNFIKVSVVKKNNKESGEFSLIFQTSPLKFSKMEVKNDLDETTIVTLNETKFGEKIDNKLFVVKDNKIPE